MALPLVASDFSGLGQLRAGQEARAQQERQFAEQLMLSRAMQQQQTQEREMYRQQRAQEYAQGLALSNRQLAQQTGQWEQSRQDAAQREARLAAERAMLRADRAGELRDYQNFQRELNLNTRTKVADDLQRAQSDQEFNLIRQSPPRDVETLNQRAGPNITFNQWEHLAQEGAAREAAEREEFKRSQQAAKMLNLKFGSRLFKSGNDDADFATFLADRNLQKLLALAAPVDGENKFEPFGREPGTSFTNWRQAAYNDPVAEVAPPPKKPAAAESTTTQPQVGWLQRLAQLAVSSSPSPVGPMLFPRGGGGPVPAAQPTGPSQQARARIRELVASGMPLNEATLRVAREGL